MRRVGLQFVLMWVGDVGGMWAGAARAVQRQYDGGRSQVRVVMIGLEAAEWRYLVGDDRAGGVGVAERDVVSGAGGAGEGGENRQHRDRQDRRARQPPRAGLGGPGDANLLPTGDREAGQASGPSLPIS